MKFSNLGLKTNSLSVGLFLASKMEGLLEPLKSFATYPAGPISEK